MTESMILSPPLLEVGNSYKAILKDVLQCVWQMPHVKTFIFSLPGQRKSSTRLGVRWAHGEGLACRLDFCFDLKS